jgi:pimeloyl-[acyl-carrier protein] synthase
MNINLLSDAFLQDPYPTYAELRALHEPIWVKQAEGISDIESVLMFSRYEDAVAIYKESQKISSNMFKVREKNEENTFFDHMMGSDGEKHKRLRSSVSEYFNSSNIEKFKPIIRQICDDLIDKMVIEHESIDLVADYAEKIPVLVIANLLGMGDADLVQMRRWSKIIGGGVDTISSSLDDINATKIALKEFLYYVKDYINFRKSHRKNEMIDYLIDLERQKILNESELYSMISFLFAAGHETTINSIGNGFWLLLTHPDQLRMIHNNFSLMSNAVEEIFRFESPLQRSSFRIAIEPVVINGFNVDPGTQISVILGSANRDETIFENADTFNILRSPNPHLSFGLGSHNCLGKHLARVEANIAFEHLLKRLPNMSLISSKPTWSRRSLLRGLTKLEVGFK